jgi:hypothetical protein
MWVVQLDSRRCARDPLPLPFDCARGFGAGSRWPEKRLCSGEANPFGMTPMGMKPFERTSIGIRLFGKRELRGDKSGAKLRTSERPASMIRHQARFLDFSSADALTSTLPLLQPCSGTPDGELPRHWQSIGGRNDGWRTSLGRRRGLLAIRWYRSRWP